MLDVIKMSAGTPRCSRCGKPLSESAFTLLLEKELPESVPQDLRLCPRCVESFEWWYRKRARSAARAAAGAGPEDSSGLSTGSGSKGSRRHRHRKKKLHPALRILILSVLTILLFAVAFYWTWAVLIRATRPVEE